VPAGRSGAQSTLRMARASTGAARWGADASPFIQDEGSQPFHNELGTEC